MSIKRTIEAIIVAGTLVGLIGCGGNDKHFVKNGKFKEYNVTASISEGGRSINIYGISTTSPQYSKDRSSIIATDFDLDGRFDEIRLNCKKGDPLEKYANLQSLEEIYSSITSK